MGYGGFIYGVRKKGEGGGCKKTPYVRINNTSLLRNKRGRDRKSNFVVDVTQGIPLDGRGGSREREWGDERGINQSHLQQFVQETGKVVVNCRRGA